MINISFRWWGAQIFR